MYWIRQWLIRRKIRRLEVELAGQRQRLQTLQTLMNGLDSFPGRYADEAVDASRRVAEAEKEIVLLIREMGKEVSK